MYAMLTLKHYRSGPNLFQSATIVIPYDRRYFQYDSYQEQLDPITGGETNPQMWQLKILNFFSNNGLSVAAMETQYIDLGHERPTVDARIFYLKLPEEFYFTFFWRITEGIFFLHT
jgi:hypothetical protein